jgi:putative tryptophan/tyrosine transport system substrate-binding protein
VIVAYTDAAALAAKAATTTIPIVFLSGSDPVRAGIVPSLNRPGESITGVSWFGVDLVPKQLSLLHELVPNAAVIALLVDRNSADAASHASEVQTAARTLRLQLVVLDVRTASDIDICEPINLVIDEGAIACVVALVILREILITPALQWRLAALHKSQPSHGSTP